MEKRRGKEVRTKKRIGDYFRLTFFVSCHRPFRGWALTTSNRVGLGFGSVGLGPRGPRGFRALVVPAPVCSALLVFILPRLFGFLYSLCLFGVLCWLYTWFVCLFVVFVCNLMYVSYWFDFVFLKVYICLLLLWHYFSFIYLSRFMYFPCFWAFASGIAHIFALWAECMNITIFSFFREMSKLL